MMDMSLFGSVYGAGNYGSCGSYTSGSCTPTTNTSSVKSSPTIATNSSTPSIAQNKINHSKKLSTTTMVNNLSNKHINSSNDGLYLSILITVIAISVLVISLFVIIRKKLNNNNEVR